MLPKRFTFPSPGFSHYWNYGSGKKMMEQLGCIPDKEEVEKNGELLGEWDTLADKIIKDVFEKEGHHKATMLIDEILNKGIDSVKHVPECLQHLFSEIDAIPAWLDMNLLNTGSTFCRRTGVFGLIVLRDYCLMGGYESSAINKPLIYTEALKKGASKRMAETVEFWVNVTGESAMQRFSIGFKSVVKVRLMHAFARVFIQKSASWNNNVWGVPINQGDMVATNLGFSLVFMEGLKKLGFRPTEKEIKGVFHLWKYIGYLLGIPVSYLPDTEEQAIASLYKWTISQPPADEDTKALAFALLNEPLSGSFPKYTWQRNLLLKTHLGYNYYFLDKRACQAMGLPKTLFRYVPYIAAFIHRISEYFILWNSALYIKAVNAGRKKQEEITFLFLKSHELPKAEKTAQMPAAD